MKNVISASTLSENASLECRRFSHAVCFTMNLWFRLFLMLCRRPWRQPAHGLDTTVVRMRVWPLDLDFNRHVTNGRYFTMADVGRMHYVLRTGASLVALRHRALPIVGDV